MKLTREILISNGVNPSLITENSECNFEVFCQTTNDHDAFCAFANKYEQITAASLNAVLALKKQGAEALKNIIEITESISKGTESLMISAFAPLSPDTKNAFFEAVICLDKPISKLNLLISQCGLQDNQETEDAKTELVLRFIALKACSSQNALTTRYNTLIKGLDNAENRLSELKSSAVLLFQKAISTVFSFTEAADKILSDTKSVRTDFNAVLNKHQLILHDIYRQLQ